MESGEGERLREVFCLMMGLALAGFWAVIGLRDTVSFYLQIDT